jgi:RNA polymerase sigma-70 factor (ECF subfamily)
MNKDDIVTPAEEAAFRRLFKEHYAAIRNFIYYKSGDMAEAEDLVQEAFAKAWEKRKTLREEQARNYLYTIANNLFINEAKHKQVVLRFQNMSKEARFAPDPQFELEGKAFEKQLNEAIANLPLKQREVFLMNRIEKQTYQEIATGLGLSVKAVEKRMGQALKALRKLSSKI